MENRKKIDELFKNELGNYTETPPPAVWDALEKKLDKPADKPRIPYTWVGYFALVCIMVAISVSVARNIFGNATTDGGIKNIAGNSSKISDKQTNSPTQTANNNTATPNDQKQNDPGITNNPTVAQPQNTGNNPQNNSQQTEPTANNNTKRPADKTQGKQTGKAGADNEAGNDVTTKRNKHNSNTEAHLAIKNSKNNNNKTGKGTQPQNEYGSSTSTKHGTKNASGETEEEKTQNVLNSSPSENKNTVVNKTSEKAESPVADVPAKEPSKDTKKPGDNSNNNNPPVHTPRPKFTRFEAGVKGGYEFGFDNDASKKVVIAPYLQYKISPKLAIMLQPAIKAASLSSKGVGGANSYYSVNKDGLLEQHTDSTYVGVNPWSPDSTGAYIWNYRYSESHDSIVKTYVTGGTYVEFELPVLLKYYITKDFSVYGGVNIIYSKLMGLTEQSVTYKSIQRTAYETGLFPVTTVMPAPSEPLSINYTGTPISSYTGPIYPPAQGSMLRFGYMFGLSYEYSKKWMFDALIQQGSVKQNIQAGYNTNTPLAAPYIRLTVGYKLTK